MNTEFIRDIIREEVMVASEVAEVIGITRQHVSVLVKKGELVPVRETSNGALFIRSDVNKYKAFKEKLHLENFKDIIGDGCTFTGLEYLRNHPVKAENVDSIFVYFKMKDAIEDGFFRVAGVIQQNKLATLEGPTMVIRMKDGDELWFDCFNCGYGGTGPTGTYKVLSDLGVPEDICEMVYEHKVIKIYNGTVWSATTKKGNDDYDYSDVEVGLFNKNKVFLQAKMPKSYIEKAPMKYLLQNIDLVPEPVNVSVYSNYAAYKTGHYIKNPFAGMDYYNVVIKDASGSELWLSVPISEYIGVEKHSSIKKLMKELGFDLGTNEKGLEGFKRKIIGTRLAVNDYLTVDKENVKARQLEG